MDELPQRLNAFALELITLSSTLRSKLAGKAAPPRMVFAFESFERAKRVYINSLNSQDRSAILQHVRTLATIGGSLGSHATRFSDDPEVRDLALAIQKLSTEFRKELDIDPTFFAELPALEGEDSSVEAASSFTLGTSPWNDKTVAAFERRLNEIEVGATQLQHKLERLEPQVREKSEAAQSLFDQAIPAIQEKTSQIDGLLGLASGRVLAGDFDSNASRELKFANWLRYASLACMGLIVLLASYTFYETALKDFDWRLALTRIAMILVLSVPAGYLARESARHRQQQYLYLQTSLSLKAIPPYIASLPDEMQHKLKSEMAQRVFASAQNVGPPDLGLLNAQDVLLELIKRLEIRR